ncbi:MAG: glycosyltransferase family 4 protein [Acidobacteria bacterium]|nr:glycosyltransferase family 4 protein [Acidobacteriota bacterium]
MNVLVFTSLWPNSEQPNFGIFVKHRIAALAQIDSVNVRVVAPVPYFPKLLRSSIIPAHWRRMARIVDCELIGGLETFHPRHLVTPKVGMTFYSRWMASGVEGLLRRLHAEWPIGLIDAHYVYPDGHAAVILGERLKIPVAITARGSDVSLFSYLPFIRPMIRHGLKRANGVIAVSSSLKQRIVELGVEPEKVAVIRNGIDLSIFYPVDRAEARRRLGLDSESQIILTVCALVRRKGIDRLIDAMRLIPGERVKLYVVGEGPERAALTTQIAEHNLADRVFLVGSRPQAGLAEWYSAADLFCLASRREGCPNVVIEAMACGTPVVASDIGGVRELIDDPRYGRIISSPTGENFAREIQIALESNWDRHGIAMQAAVRPWSKVAEETLAYINHIHCL